MIILHHRADVTPPIRKSDMRKRMASYPHRASRRFQQAQDDLGQRRLSASSGADNCHMLAGTQGEIDVFQYPIRTLGVAKAHIVKVNLGGWPITAVESLRHGARGLFRLGQHDVG
ncbi:hypothetical protein D3C78_1196040 [compost metagenome]